jgi:lysylphosphatidylglycerol synthetase-like protein (DUF2156 family)
MGSTGKCPAIAAADRLQRDPTRESQRRLLPNGVDEPLSVDMIAEAKRTGAVRLSLAFAAFPELFDATHPGPLQRVALRLIHLLGPLIRLESLYRYLRKFHSPAERRYVVLCAHHIPAALMVLLSLEFMPRPRQLRLTHQSAA